MNIPKGATVECVRITISQKSDDFDDDQNGQELTVESFNGGCGTYLAVTTKRWAFDPDEIDDMARFFREVLELSGQGEAVSKPNNTPLREFMKG